MAGVVCRFRPHLNEDFLEGPRLLGYMMAKLWLSLRQLLALGLS